MLRMIDLEEILLCTEFGETYTSVYRSTLYRKKLLASNRAVIYRSFSGFPPFQSVFSPLCKLEGSPSPLFLEYTSFFLVPLGAFLCIMRLLPSEIC